MNKRNPRWNHAGTIDCEIEHPRFGWIPFTADPNDPEPLGREVYAELMTLPSASIPAFVPTLITREQQEDVARYERDLLLARSDWTQLNDVPTSTRAAWSAYRQALRDLPAQAGFPHDIAWPEPPSGPARLP